MAISFSKLKSPLLNYTDKITVGKLSGCRVCDVIPDYYEYLIWAEKTGLFKFTKLVRESIQEHLVYANQKTIYTQEIAPYLTEPKYSDIEFEDVPF